MDETISTKLMLSDLLSAVKSIDGRLATIERCITKPDLAAVLVKGEYSLREVAGLSKDYGCKPAAQKTIQMACADGRIPDATKDLGNHWRLSREVVLRILQEGVPAERRNVSSEKPRPK